ncbi:hypothetical protein ODZ83_08575 [Acaricomes phytoseiuli]|uniref:hypothetical protein n=1 Tax=Acaricomes phytoseiuli TaxID=291968 RepID=UPI000381859C|nr:hypothetical protein [Acaricomes phytoseiuli]MCW1250229.1 hypothetical protein [Acaricomes phytoseiuli]
MDNVISEIMQRWWLIFLLPAFAGIIRSTFGIGKRGDRRRGDVNSGTSGPGHAMGSRVRSRQQNEATKLMAAHDAVNEAWLSYELDVAKLIDFPMMSDVREPRTVDFLRAKRIADGLRPDDLEALEDERLAEYRTAVRNFEVSFEVAERQARRVKDQNFSVAERQRLETAKRLLRMAEDTGATPAERRLAYQRARKELDGLVALPEEAIAALEQRLQASISSVVERTVKEQAVSKRTAKAVDPRNLRNPAGPDSS